MGPTLPSPVVTKYDKAMCWPDMGPCWPRPPQHPMTRIPFVLAACTAGVLANAPFVLAQPTTTSYSCTTSGGTSYCFGNDGSSLSTVRSGKEDAYTFGFYGNGRPLSCSTTGSLISCQ